MAYPSPPDRARRAWSLAKGQHWAIAGFQLLELGYTRRAIRHRVDIGRLHLVFRGVYAVGRRELTRKGTWMGAILACRFQMALSHETAGALWGICGERGSAIHVAGTRGRDHRVPGVTSHENIPVTTPVRTLIDLGTRLPSHSLEAAINEADKLDLIDPNDLRAALDERRGQRGVGAVREILERGEFVLTDSALEGRFLPNR
jgi:hypothetical protein